MAQDLANIYKLSKELLKDYESNPFLDCLPVVKEFACNLEREIASFDTPCVMSLEAGFGMGKTFFSTRFCQYLRSNNKNVVYLSVWESDYFSEPFVPISKEIIKQLNKMRNPKAKLKTFLDRTIKASEAFSISLAGIVTYNPAQIAAAYLPDETNPLQEFKTALEEAIKKTDSKKLIIIIDDLDRCRPDYAIKVLEAVKHFFDIPGLFVLIPVNISILTQAVESIYGKTNIGESYLAKLIQHSRAMQGLSVEHYEPIVKQELKKELLQKAFESNILIDDEEYFNSYSVLLKSVAYYAHQNGLSLRKTILICRELISFLNSFNQQVLIEQFVFSLIKHRNPRSNSYTSEAVGVSPMIDGQLWENVVKKTKEKIKTSFVSSFCSCAQDTSHLPQSYYSFRDNVISWEFNQIKENLNNIKDQFISQVKWISKEDVEKAYVAVKTVYEVVEKKYGPLDANERSEIRGKYQEIISKPLSRFTGPV